MYLQTVLQLEESYCLRVFLYANLLQFGNNYFIPTPNLEIVFKSTAEGPLSKIPTSLSLAVQGSLLTYTYLTCMCMRYLYVHIYSRYIVCNNQRVTLD